MSKVTVVGAGNVGATCANVLAFNEVADEVVMLDVKEGVSEGKAMDMMQTAQLLGFDTNIVGCTNDYEKTANSDVVVITSGIPRKPGMTREELIGVNAGIVKSVAQNILKYSPNAIIVVISNPMDTMTYLSLKALGLPKNRIIGMGGALDSSRFKYFLSQALGCNANEVEGMVIGGHGDTTMIPLTRFATYKGMPVSNFLSEEKLQEVAAATMVGGATLTKLLGTSAWYAPGAAGAFVVESIIHNQGKMVPCSVYLEGEYGESDICCGVPVILGKNGIEKIVELPLNEEEKAKFEEEQKQAERRRNPYCLKFGQVSEEEIIRGAIESGVAVFLHGPSSEGKSARVKQIDPTCEIIYLRNATPESLNGKSVYNGSTGEMMDVPPTWLKKLQEKCEKEPDRFHVVFFDEITNALPSIQGIAFNIVLDREVNGIWKLPENARIVAAGNDMKDSLAANQLAEPLFNRFAHVYIKTTTEGWLKWASEHNIHPAIYSYIAYKKGETLRSKYDGEKPNADPRKWEMASKMLYATGSPEMLRALVGEDITREFVEFCNQQVITLDDVINGNYTDRDIQSLNTAERYATTMGLTRVDDNNLEKVRGFVTGLGAEFGAIFDALWTHGDESKLERLAEAKLAEMPGGGIRR